MTGRLLHVGGAAVLSAPSRCLSRVNGTVSFVRSVDCTRLDDVTLTEDVQIDIGGFDQIVANGYV